MSLVRLSKLMASQGLCSRREADQLIEAGQVFVDGLPITTLGTRVSPTSNVTLARAAQERSKRLVTVILNKPPGYVSGQAERGYPDAATLITRTNQWGPKQAHLPRPKSLNVAGRLDIDSTGLLVLTQDGRIARRLIGPKNNVPKSYKVRVKGKITTHCVEQLRFGIQLDGRTLKQAKVEKITETSLVFELIEGRKRQIRRMCEIVGLEVHSLHRDRIGKISIGRLPRGRWRFLKDGEYF